jgi:MinD superfamily P-loop ATPase
MKIVTILSGKGGVGKSSIAASLAISLSQKHKIICADCDVDASNLSLVFGAEKYEQWQDLSTNEKAFFDDNKCTSCKKCYEMCYFQAIDWKNNHPILKKFSCEGCGLCALLCKEKAISMKKINNAKIGYARTRYGFPVVSAQLSMGESGSGKVVSEVRRMAWNLDKESDFMLIDSAAGVGCPVIASVVGAHYAIIVTEPTPSSFLDAQKALSIVNHFKISSGIIINKYDINEGITKNIEEYAKKEKLAILAKIPFDKKFVMALTKMQPIVTYDTSYVKIFNSIQHSVLQKIKEN